MILNGFIGYLLILALSTPYAIYVCMSNSGYYNTQRKHSTINYMTPKEFEYKMESQLENSPKKWG
jgi:hypothetical protein